MHCLMHTLYTAVYVNCIYIIIVLCTFIDICDEGVSLSAQSFSLMKQLVFKTNAFNSESHVNEKYFLYRKKK